MLIKSSTSPSIYAIFERHDYLQHYTTLAFPPQILSTATDFFDADPPPGSDAGDYCGYYYLPGYNWTQVNLSDMQ
jgi:hypothetical protein